MRRVPPPILLLLVLCLVPAAATARSTSPASGHFDRNRMRGRISVSGSCAQALTFTATR